MEELLQFLGAIRKLSPECIAYLQKIVRGRKIRKGELLLKIGEVNRHLFFIIKGELHCHYYEGNKHLSDWFFGPGHTVVSIGSFYTQVPSKDYIVANTDCDLLFITKEEYDYLGETFPEFCVIIKILLEKYLVE